MRILTSCVVVMLLLAGVVPASAELIFFSTGRTMSVAGHRVEGESIVIQLRGGGEMTFKRHLVSRIGPDEVPYPAEEEAGQGASLESPFAHVQAPEVYASLIDRVSAQQGIDAQIVKAVIQVESGYHPRARSPKGAMGLMQLMPATARQYAVRNPYDPATNIEAGAKHLSTLLRRFDLPLALAAYNAGEAAVRRFGGIPPYPETRAYVARILSLLRAAI